MVKGKIFLALGMLTILLISGCLATKEESECQNLKSKAFTETWRVGEASMCYQELAIQYALNGDTEGAVEACMEAGNTTNLVSSFAEANKNNCFSDIAAITHNETICNYISTGILEEPIGGVWSSYTEECKKKVTEYNYDLEGCGGFFPAVILPLIAAFIARKNYIGKTQTEEQKTGN